MYSGFRDITVIKNVCLEKRPGLQKEVPHGSCELGIAGHKRNEDILLIIEPPANKLAAEEARPSEGGSTWIL